MSSANQKLVNQPTELSKRALNRHREHFLCRGPTGKGWAPDPNPMVIKQGSVLILCPCGWLGWFKTEEWKALTNDEVQSNP